MQCKSSSWCERCNKGRELRSSEQQWFCWRLNQSSSTSSAFSCPLGNFSTAANVYFGHRVILPEAVRQHQQFCWAKQPHTRLAAQKMLPEGLGHHLQEFSRWCCLNSYMCNTELHSASPVCAFFALIYGPLCYRKCIGFIRPTIKVDEAAGDLWKPRRHTSLCCHVLHFLLFS